MAKLLLCVALLVIVVQLAWASNDERRLLQTLMQDYNRMERPVANHRDAVKVKIDPSLRFIKFDAEENRMKTHAWLKMEWRDENLLWNPSEYGNITVLRMCADKVWRPDISLYNSNCAKGYFVEAEGKSKVLVYNTGKVLWVPPVGFKSHCRIDESQHDTRTCTLKFGSWVYSAQEIDLESEKPTANLEEYEQRDDWRLVSAPAERHSKVYPCCPEAYIDVVYTLNFECANKSRSMAMTPDASSAAAPITINTSTKTNEIPVDVLAAESLVASAAAAAESAENETGDSDAPDSDSDTSATPTTETSMAGAMRKIVEAMQEMKPMLEDIMPSNNES